MSDRFEVGKGERGIVRLFALDLPEGEAAGFAGAALEEALGAGGLDAQYVEVFPVADLKGLGLSGYMTEGLGIPAEQIEGDRARLDGLKGHVLVLLSGAFGGRAATLTPRAPLRWIGTYTEEHAPVTFAPLPSDAAAGEVTGGGAAPPSRAAISGRVAMVALLVIAALTAVMIWVAS